MNKTSLGSRRGRKAKDVNFCYIDIIVLPHWIMEIKYLQTAGFQNTSDTL